MNNIVSVKGTAFEQGAEHGRVLASVIRTNLQNVRAKLVDDKVDMGRYRSFVQKNADFMEKKHPDLVEEMKGIAQGAKLGFEDILTLNIPAYFLTKYLQQECSMIMVRGKATADGCTYLIKNRDMGTMIEQAVIRRELADGTGIIEINGAGTVTYPANGINSHGLGVATTGFWSKAAAPDLSEVDATHIFVNTDESTKTI
jgi:predicted choloylglycine hydrolase